MTQKQLIEKMLEMIKANDMLWQVHHCAENKYCPFCCREDEFWEDQTKHHEGCPFVNIVQEAEKALGRKR